MGVLLAWSGSFTVYFHTSCPSEVRVTVAAACVTSMLHLLSRLLLVVGVATMGRMQHAARPGQSAYPALCNQAQSQQHRPPAPGAKSTYTNTRQQLHCSQSINLSTSPSPSISQSSSQSSQSLGPPLRSACLSSAGRDTPCVHAVHFGTGLGI